jgi:hypothetical protein
MREVAGMSGREMSSARAAGYTHGLVGCTLEIHAGLHGCDDIPQVRGEWVEAEHDFHTCGIDLNFEGIDFLVIRYDRIAPILIPVEKTLLGVFQASEG